MKSSGEKKIAMFFERIKKDIFPEWDRKNEWRVKNFKHDSSASFIDISLDFIFSTRPDEVCCFTFHSFISERISSS